jgi:hypothetical protein
MESRVLHVFAPADLRISGPTMRACPGQVGSPSGMPSGWPPGPSPSVPCPSWSAWEVGQGHSDRVPVPVQVPEAHACQLRLAQGGDRFREHCAPELHNRDNRLRDRDLGRARNHSSVQCGAATVTCLAYRTYDTASRTNNTLGRISFGKCATENIACLVDANVSVSADNAESRIAHLLVSLACGIGKDRPDGIVISVGNKDLAPQST